MKHLCDVEVAIKYGIEVSMFLENISFLIKHNYSNDKHFYDGRYWTYNTQEALMDFFPYWSRDQIKRIIKKSFDANLLIKGNFNKLSYDRTTWFSLTDYGHELYRLTLGRNCPMGRAEAPNGLGEIAQPIPDINQIQTQIKDKDKAQPKKPVASEENTIVLPDWLPEELWKEFKQHRKEIKKPMTLLAQKKTIAQLEKMRANGQDITSVINQSIANGWQGIFELKSQGSGNGNNQQKSDWQIEYFKRELGYEFPFSGKANITQPKAAISTEVPEYLQERRRAEQSRYDMDTCFGDYFGSELYVGNK